MFCILLLLLLIIIIAILMSTNKSKENFGEINDNNLTNDDSTIGNLLQQIKPNTEELLNIDEENKQNSNFNTVNNLPFLINPTNNNDGYYFERVKLVTNKNSPLLKMGEINMQNINNTLKKCSKLKKNENLGVGYNKFEDLQNSSYANITSIGKSLLTPYLSFPVPS